MLYVLVKNDMVCFTIIFNHRLFFSGSQTTATTSTPIAKKSGEKFREIAAFRNIA